MIVQPPGIRRDPAASGVVQRLLSRVARVIVHADQDQRLGAGHYLAQSLAAA